MKGKYGIVLFFILLFLWPKELLWAKGVTYKKILHGKNVYDTVWVDLNEPGVMITVQVPSGFPLTAESFRSMVNRSRPAAAITGTYFNMSSHVPVGDIVMFGQLIHYGGIGTAMAVTDDKNVIFRRVPAGYTIHWDKYETVLAAGPTLLSKGELDLNPEMEKFSDKRIYGSAMRCAVGWREDRSLILLTSRKAVSLKELALTFKSMNCREAMNLDGGSSSALFCKGTYYKEPKRTLTNLLLVFDSPQRYKEYRKSSAYTFYCTGEKFRSKGKPFQAMLNFRGATAADPSSAGYFKNLASTYSSLGWEVWTSWALSKAAEIYDTKGFADKALYYYQKAILVSDENAIAHRWMADYYKKTGDKKRQQDEEKALSRCLFSSLALRQDLFTPSQPLLWYQFLWENHADGWIHDKTYGIRMRIPSGWEITDCKSYFMIMQNSDPQNKFFMSFEAIKSEVFTGLDRTIKLIREKRGGEIVSSQMSQISGFPGCSEIISGIRIDGKPWMLSTTYVKRSRWVFVMTFGSPQEDFAKIREVEKDVLGTFSLDTQFEPYL